MFVTSCGHHKIKSDLCSCRYYAMLPSSGVASFWCTGRAPSLSSTAQKIQNVAHPKNKYSPPPKMEKIIALPQRWKRGCPSTTQRNKEVLPINTPRQQKVLPTHTPKRQKKKCCPLTNKEKKKEKKNFPERNPPTVLLCHGGLVNKAFIFLTFPACSFLNETGSQVSRHNMFDFIQCLRGIF